MRWAMGGSVPGDGRPAKCAGWRERGRRDGRGGGRERGEEEGGRDAHQSQGEQEWRDWARLLSPHRKGQGAAHILLLRLATDINAAAANPDVLGVHAVALVERAELLVDDLGAGVREGHEGRGVHGAARRAGKRERERERQTELNWLLNGVKTQKK